MSGPITVRGIDGDEENRSIVVEGKTPADLARELWADHWKFAVLQRDGGIVGGIQLDTRLLRRTWWGDPE